MTCARILQQFSSLLKWQFLCLKATTRTSSQNSCGVRKLSTCSSVMETLMRKGGGRKVVVMGIESSCDDTGVALVDEDGRVLGDAIHSQLLVHKETGGIVPHVAGQLHHQNLESVTSSALEKSGCGMEDVSVVAVTVGPGLAPCLKAGLSFAKEIAQKHELPLCPVHHMEAHALMPRQMMKIPFPFLVLLVSGGHCILAVAESPGVFQRLGETRDDSPGEALDKVARWLGLNKHHGVPSRLHGGAAIEVLARQGCPEKMEELAVSVMTKSRCCDFSFSGLKTRARNIIERIASENGWVELEGGGPLPQCEHIAAAFQETVFKHLLQRTQRALLYCRESSPQVKHLVVSGGVASNQYLREKLANLCADHTFTLHTPPPHLCTDNGIMIAWAALEHLKWAGHSEQSPWQQSAHSQSMDSNKEKSLQLLYHGREMDGLDFRPRWPLGEDISEVVKSLNIKLPKSYYFKRQTTALN